MTTVLQPSRALALRLFSRGPSTPVLFSSLRVRHDQNAAHPTSLSYSNAGNVQSRLGQSQNYATASRPGRPKAHTGRAVAAKRKTASTTSTATKAATKTATTKKAAAKKAAAKKAAKPKQKTKAKAKPKPKRKPRVLTEKQKANKEKKAATLKQKNLRAAALLTPRSATPPKVLPRTAYMVISQENQVAGVTPTENAKASAAKYKALTAEEREVR